MEEILETFDALHWRYVPTSLNPADDVSRGIPTEELTISHRFFTGPAFMRYPLDSWPPLPYLPLAQNAQPDPEIRTLKFTGLAKAGTHFIDTLLASVRPLSRIKRTMAYVVR